MRRENTSSKQNYVISLYGKCFTIRILLCRGKKRKTNVVFNKRTLKNNKQEVNYDVEEKRENRLLFPPLNGVDSDDFWFLIAKENNWKNIFSLLFPGNRDLGDFALS